ncbi:MAG: AraC family transcriptional regulator, partial [Bacteroidales bacterium]|nr:AraC family transcriptional regulator [Bacteroidales bacterium]
NYWIQQHVTITAKTLLRTEEQFSLQEISERLGFPDLASFSRYFKRETGISPREYRKGNV